MKIRTLTLLPALCGGALLLAACGSKKSANLPAAMPDAATPIVDVDDYFPVPLAEGIAPTPPMGWNSWNHFSCSISASLVEQIADAMLDSGMQAAGYQYINIDDCWAQVERAADGSVQTGPNFPQGMAPVAEYVHAKGLKLGLYSDRGVTTCAGRAGSADHEARDAQSYADWGVDYLKYDNCPADQRTPAEEATRRAQYEAMRDALAATGRPIVYSLCAWNFYEWGVSTGNLWRTTTDIQDNWDSIIANALNNRALAAYAGPNGWNDPDMLEVGNSGLTTAEYQAHFSLWAIMAAPLIAGNDLRVLTPEIKDILTNTEVIAIDQDALGLQGVPVRTEGNLSVWAKPLNESGARAVVLLNRGTTPQDMNVGFSEIGLRSGAAAVRDLWAHADLGSFQDTFSANVPAHAAMTLKIRGTEPPRPAGSAYLSDLTWTYAANRLGPIEKDKSNGVTAPNDGAPIAIRGQGFAKGLGVSAPSMVIYRLGKACQTFSAQVGVDDSSAGRGSVAFQVWADSEKVFQSDVLTGTSPPEAVEVNLDGKSRLKLVVTSGEDDMVSDLASWGDAKLDCTP